MTVYEHAMFGASLALAVGGQRRHGWPVVIMAGVAAVLPDFDGLSLAFGAAAFAEVHRVWGHNLLVAVLAGGLAGGLGYLCYRASRTRPTADTAPPVRDPFSAGALVVWVVIGVLAGLSHLLADVFYSGGEGQMPWPVPLLWPWRGDGWMVPIIPWGDIVTTLLFVAEMFALYRWPKRGQLTACVTLLAVVGYVGVRWLAVGFV